MVAKNEGTIMKKICVYCGKEATTRDHVPPKGFFREPFPANLKTVPACFDCNNGNSADEDYLRNVFAMSYEEGNISTEIAKDVWEQKVTRTIGKNKKFLNDISNSFKDINVFQDGKYLGKKASFKIEREKVEKAISKMIRGLYYIEYNSILDPSYEIRIFENIELSIFPQNVVNDVFSKPIKQFGEGVVRYRTTRAKEDPNFSIWVINFYNYRYMYFVCFSYAKDFLSLNKGEFGLPSVQNI